MKDFTLQNVGEPTNDKDVATKKYVDNFGGGAFEVKNGGYNAKGHLYIGGNKIGGIKDPKNDGEAANKRYVDNYVEKYVTDYVEKFKDENDFFTLPWDIDMAGKKIFSLPEPMQDDEPATKKYVDDLQTHYIDQKGNIKFNRNINVSNQRIFSLKDPKKPYEAANKKYVDDSINKRIEEEKDNFLPQDPATKQYVDEAIKDLAGGDVLVSKEGVFIKENGHYRATAPLNIDNQKMENLPEPEEDGDAVNKKYVDGVIESLTLKQGLIRENGGFNLVDSYINMNFNSIRNVGNPVHSADATPKNYVDKEIRDNIKGVVTNQLKELNQLVGICGSFTGDLVKGDYQFTFGESSQSKNKDIKMYNGFLVPTVGVIKHFSVKTNGLKILPNLSEYSSYKITTIPKPLYTLVLIKTGNQVNIEEIEDIGTIFFSNSNISRVVSSRRRGENDIEIYRYNSTFNYEFRVNPKYLNKEENFLCSVNEGDIINIRSEFTEEKFGGIISYVFPNKLKEDRYRSFYNGDSFTHLATITFLFKEMSFPNILELDPLDN